MDVMGDNSCKKLGMAYLNLGQYSFYSYTYQTLEFRIKHGSQDLDELDSLRLVYMVCGVPGVTCIVRNVV